MKSSTAHHLAHHFIKKQILNNMDLDYEEPETIEKQKGGKRRRKLKSPPIWAFHEWANEITYYERLQAKRPLSDHEINKAYLAVRWANKLSKVCKIRKRFETQFGTPSQPSPSVSVTEKGTRLYYTSNLLLVESMVTVSRRYEPKRTHGPRLGGR